MSAARLVSCPASGKRKGPAKVAVLANEELPGVRKAANWRAKDVLPDILALPSFLVKDDR